MGKKGPLAMVTPEQYRERTGLRLSSRSGTTLKVDSAYADYYRDRSEGKRSALHAALREYVAAHGGFWSDCERDKVSGGLMEWLFRFTAPTDPPRPQADSAADFDLRAATRIAEYEIPHSRFGVLYLLGNIDIDVNWLNVGLEGVSVVGGAVGMGLGTDMNRLHEKSSAIQTGIKMWGTDLDAQTIVKGGSLAVKHAPKVYGKVTDLLDTNVQRNRARQAQLQNATSATLTVRAPVDVRGARPVAPPPPDSPLPMTVSALLSTAQNLTDAYNHHRYLGYAAVGASPFIYAGHLAAEAGRKVWQAIRDAVIKFKNMIMDKLVYPIGLSGQATTIASIAKAIAMIVIDKVMKEAAPVIGAVKDLATGVVKTLDSVATRLASYLDRRRIHLNPGHPEEIANSIESCMTMGIFKGLLDILKGAGKAAVQATLPGLGQLVSVLMTAIEWMVKFIMRLVENYCIKAFLEIARGYWEIEKQRATRVDHHVQDIGGGNTFRFALNKGGSRLGSSQRLEPNMRKGGIITDTKKFTEFFKFGCEASPIIPMLTLNAGICGSLMTMIRMFDDTGEMIRPRAPGSTKKSEFDIGGQYFKRLKEFSAAYMKASGFRFRARDSSNEYVKGLLHHAVQHHQGKWTVIGAAKGFITAT
jgi:hypothetical protein